MFKIKQYTLSDEFEWERIVRQGNNGTLFHLRSFLNYHPSDRFKDHSLIIEKKGKLFSVFPAAEQIVKGKKHLISHPGSTVGSFVVPESLSIANALELASGLIEYAKKHKFEGIRITLPPNLYQSRLSNYMDFALFNNDFFYLKRDVTSILFLEKTLEKTVKKFRASHKRAIRKARENGVAVRQSNDFKTFYKILEKNLSIRHGVKPTHSLKELIHLQSIFPDRVNLFSAFIGETMVAGVINFIINEHVVLAFYISHDEDYIESRAVNLLFYSIFDWAIQERYKVYDFGTFTTEKGPNMGLGRFKENFGASGIFRDTIERTL